MNTVRFANSLFSGCDNRFQQRLQQKPHHQHMTPQAEDQHYSMKQPLVRKTGFVPGLLNIVLQYNISSEIIYCWRKRGPPQ